VRAALQSSCAGTSRHSTTRRPHPDLPDAGRQRTRRPPTNVGFVTAAHGWLLHAAARPAGTTTWPTAARSGTSSGRHSPAAHPAAAATATATAAAAGFAPLTLLQPGCLLIPRSPCPTDGCRWRRRSTRHKCRRRAQCPAGSGPAAHGRPGKTARARQQVRVHKLELLFGAAVGSRRSENSATHKPWHRRLQAPHRFDCTLPGIPAAPQPKVCKVFA
jgi:hypothetical protein